MKKNKIDISKIDLEKEREKVTDLPGLLEYAHTVGGAVIKPTDRGKIKGQAVAAMYDQTDRQMQQIFDQIKVLAKQANEIKERVSVSERIYEAEIGFQPVIYQTYYLYQRASGKDVLSMIGPKEWGKKMPFEQLVAQVKLLPDHTWEIIA